MIAGIAHLYLLVHALIILARFIVGPKPVKGVPYSLFDFWFPFGCVITLGWHFYTTGEVFDWLSLQTLHLKSPMIQLFIPNFSFTKPVLVLADLHEIEDIVTRRMHEIDRSHLMHEWFGLLVPRATIGKKTNTEFKQQRRLWNTILAPSFLRTVAAPGLHAAIEKMIRLWEAKAKTADGLAFQVDLDLRQAALEGMWDMIIGRPMGVLDSLQENVQYGRVSRNPKRGYATFTSNKKLPDIYEALSRMFTCMDWITTGLSAWMYSLFFTNVWPLPSANRTVNGVLYPIIANAKQLDGSNFGLSRPSGALEEALSRDMNLNHNSGNAAEEVELRDEILELLITGHETTASSTGWALKYLADNQEAQRALRTCLRTTFTHNAEGNLPSAQEVIDAELPYLDAVIAETLRLSCTGPVSFRETTQDCQIFGHEVPAGTPLVLVMGGPSYNIEKDQIPEIVPSRRSHTSQKRLHNQGLAVWDQRISLNKFCPDRWLTEDGAFNPKAGPSLPFSAGPRGCFGKKIALLELRLMLTMITLSFNLPQLPPNLSKYSSRDSLTRKSSCCYIRPEKIDWTEHDGPIAWSSFDAL